MLILRFNKGDKGYFEITVISLNGLLDYHDLLQVDRPRVWNWHDYFNSMQDGPF